MDKALLVPESNHNLLIRHSNKIAEARYHLTIGEQRLILLMVSMIKRNDKDFKSYEMRISDFFRLLEIKNKDYKRVQIITKNLLSKVLEIEENNSLLQVHWLSSVKYLHNEGVIKLSFDPELKPYFLDLKTQFTKYHLSKIIHFRSAYTIRIYQLLKSNEYRGFMDFSYQELREILGIKEKKYPLYKNFRNKVLDQAKKELEEKTHNQEAYKSDLSFSLKVLERKARKIHKIRFNIIKQNYQEALTLDILGLEPQEPRIPTKQQTKKQDINTDIPEYKAMLEISIPKNQASAFLKQYKIGYITEKLQVLKERQQKENIKNPSGFFIKALREDWKSQLIQQQQIEAKEKENKEIQRKEQERQKAIYKAKSKKIIAKMDAFFENLDAEEQAKVILEYQNSNFYGVSEMVEYHAHGLKSERAKIYLRRFLFSKKEEYGIFQK